MRFAVVIVFLVLSAAASGWWCWSTTPQYAIEQARSALITHDLKKFHRYVDADKVSLNIAKDLQTEYMRDLLGKSGTVLMHGFLHLFRPDMALGINQEILNYVQYGSFTSADPIQDKTPPHGLSLAKIDNYLEFTACTCDKISDATVNGGEAIFSLRLHNDRLNADLPLKVVLSKEDRSWKVTRFSNVPAFCTTLAKRREAMPAPLSASDPAKKKD